MKRKHKELINRLAELSVCERDSDTIYVVNGVLQLFANNYKKSFNQMARCYSECIRRIYSKRNVEIEHAGDFKSIDCASILKNLGLCDCVAISNENNRLIGGFKVTHDDIVWDFSIKGQLNHLIQQFKKI